MIRQSDTLRTANNNPDTLVTCDHCALVIATGNDIDDAWTRALRFGCYIQRNASVEHPSRHICTSCAPTVFNWATRIHPTTDQATAA